MSSNSSSSSSSSRAGYKLTEDGRKVRYLVKTGEELPERSFKQPAAAAESSSSDSSAAEPPAGDAPSSA
uniref:Large ribosomal subunit protein uL24 C-terminal domain-containing protein n=1 Tax=Tetradesmus obliquus TaxID=3088 RepID=A0A383W9G3_TETOB